MYAAIFLMTAESLGPRKIISAPEAIEATTVEEARKEGLQILNELPPHNREVMKPISIVELSEDMMTGIAGCERLFLSNAEDDGELEFVDVSEATYWQSQPWWSR